MPGQVMGPTLGLDCPTRLPDEAERLTAALGAQLADNGITLRVHIHPEREDYAHMATAQGNPRSVCVWFQPAFDLPRAL